jgi:hypothetical protein
MWRQVLSLPQTGIGWWALGLAGPVWALWLFGIIATLLSGDAITGEGVFMALLFTGWWGLFGTVLGLIAVLLSHERSLLVWLAMVPGLAFVSFAIMLLLEI